MKEYWQEFWNTKAGFERVTRSVVFILGALMQSGVIPGGSAIGIAVQGAALLIAAGQKNEVKP